MINIQFTLCTTPDWCKIVSLAVLFGSNGNSCTVSTQSDMCTIYTHSSQCRNAGRAEETQKIGTAVNAACRSYDCPGLGQCRVKFLSARIHIADNFWRSSFACENPEFISTGFPISPATS